MHFDFSDKTKELQKRLTAFMDEHIYPNERLVLAADRTEPLAAGSHHREA